MKYATLGKVEGAKGDAAKAISLMTQGMLGLVKAGSAAELHRELPALAEALAGSDPVTSARLMAAYEALTVSIVSVPNKVEREKVEAIRRKIAGVSAEALAGIEGELAGRRSNEILDYVGGALGAGQGSG